MNIKTIIKNEMEKLAMEQNLSGKEVITKTFLFTEEQFNLFLQDELEKNYTYDVVEFNKEIGKYVVSINYCQLDDGMEEYFATWEEYEDLSLDFNLIDMGMSGKYYGYHWFQDEFKNINIYVK